MGRRIIQNQALMVALAILLGYASVLGPALLFWLIFIFPSTVLITVIAWVFSCIGYAMLKIYVKVHYPT